MNRLTYILIFLVSLNYRSYAQGYAIANIPDTLKLNADCIIRNSIKEIELSSINSGIERVKKALTIFNKNGEDLATLVIPYDKNSKVNVNQINLYNKIGKKTQTIDLSKVQDHPSFSQTLFSDERLKYFKPEYADYPYTVEYDYEVELKNMISYEYWCPLYSVNLSVEHAKLSLSYPKDIQISIKEIGTSRKNAFELNTNNVIKWEVNDLVAQPEEPFAVNIDETNPKVILMPAILKYKKRVGPAENWESFGKWMYELYEEKDELTESSQNKIRSLVSNSKDTLQRIQLLYDYLQENTRYVNVKLGLGGFEPFSAQSVSETGYGDCKALTNYMYTLLKIVGIKSYPALVASGRYIKPIFKDFPNLHQFDHVILCVPLMPDTIWLECTSQSLPFGFIGDFTDDRDVLLITESGGKFAHTKKYDEKKNIRTGRSTLQIDSSGTASCKIQMIYEGLQYNDAINYLSQSNDELKNWLYKNSNLPSLQVINLKVNNTKDLMPQVSIEESLISKNYGSFSGKYMVLPLNLINVQPALQKIITKRFSDMNINRSYTDFDTIEYLIPSNYKVESLPKNISISSKYGEYSSSVSLVPTGYIYVRKYSLYQGRYSFKEYEALYNFILAVSKADKMKVMLSPK